MTGTVKYPNVHVQLAGLDGNAFSIIGRVSRAMQEAGLDQDAIDAYRRAATSNDYDHLLRVTMHTVDCD